jgi:hypothetical protein
LDFIQSVTFPTTPFDGSIDEKKRRKKRKDRDLILHDNVAEEMNSHVDATAFVNRYPLQTRATRLLTPLSARWIRA